MNNQIEKLLEHVRVNEQIERLAKESGCTIDRLGFGEGNLEKFAKLMAKEFIKVAGEQMGYSQYCAMRDKVTTHFGVE